VDDLLKRTTIKTKDKLTKSDLNDFWMWICIKAERMGFEIEHREPKEKVENNNLYDELDSIEIPDPKKEYIEKITG
jgi:hypothetical protein